MRNLTLLTDLYQLTMMNGYIEKGVENNTSVFDVFFRQNGQITYSVFAGLEQAIEYVTNINFGDEEIEYLQSLNLFGEKFLKYLRTFKFSGDIYSVKEGDVVFPGEPILTVKAPIIEAQLIETAILNILNHQTLIATKSAKIINEAKGGSVLEFGLRRAQGPDAGIYGARAAIIGGCNATSNVLCGKEFDVPVAGTHSHSWVMSFPDEYTAFKAYADIYPSACLLLVDTYDTLNSGVPTAIKVFKELVKKGYKPLGIRLDSGDLAYLTKEARKMLDEAGFTDAKICASGDLDEKSIQSLLHQGAKIDMWGIGTKLITSLDMPSLGGVYKLSAIYENGKEIPKIKVSDNADKITNPCFKTFYRIYDKDTGRARADLITRFDEKFDESVPLTIFHPIETWKTKTFDSYRLRNMKVEIIKNGEVVYEFPKLKEIQNYCKKELETFWEEYRRLDEPHIYKVDLSENLYKVKNKMLKKLRG